MVRTIIAAGMLLLACAPVQAADLIIKVEGLRSNKGVLNLALYDKEKGFPSKSAKISGGKTPVTGGTVAYSFKNLAPGTYAVAIYHDENGNDKFDSSWLGLPQEGYGFSNNAKATLSAPSYKDAAITVDSDTKSISIKVTYW